MGQIVSKAKELFTAVPKLHNCEQAVVAAAGREDLVEQMRSNGGGRAPEGMCGALYAALQLIPNCDKASAIKDFEAELEYSTCKERLANHPSKCVDCVVRAAYIVEKYGTRRSGDVMRDVSFECGFTKYPAGSVLIRHGNTWVLCTASVEEKVPSFLRDSGQGWVTAEYSMLPGSTLSRKDREIKKGKADARGTEIGRLVGRALRASIDMKKLGERTITIDCDVLQADGGTRCASITGGMVALVGAVNKLLEEGLLEETPIKYLVSAVSVGICNGEPFLDLDYVHDSSADVDLNVIMTEDGRFVEIQGTAEHEPFSQEQLDKLLSLARKGNKELIEKMLEVLKK